MAYDAWGVSFGSPSAWSVSWVHAATHVDTHDGFVDERKHTDAEKKRIEEYKQAREQLRAQITESFAIATGEQRYVEPQEVPRYEKRAGQLPKQERPVYRRTFMQIANWHQELAQVTQILANLERERMIREDDEDFAEILRFL